MTKSSFNKSFQNRNETHNYSTSFSSAYLILHSPTPRPVSSRMAAIVSNAYFVDNPVHLSNVYAEIPVLWIPAPQCNKVTSLFVLRYLYNYFKSSLSFYISFSFPNSSSLAPSKWITLCLIPNSKHGLSSSSGNSFGICIETRQVMPRISFSSST